MGIQVGKILEDQDYDLQLSMMAGELGLSREVQHTRAHRPGLALAGEMGSLDEGRIQVLGTDEVMYLNSRPQAHQESIVSSFLDSSPACVMVAQGLDLPDSLRVQASQRCIPVFISPLTAEKLIDRIDEFLQERLGLTHNLHGVLVDVLGVGVLILGKSGIGKSESALDLVVRGHRLIADDVVMLKKRQPATVYGSCSPIIQHHMEIRGLGIINIKDLFGVSAVRDRKKVELVIELEEWQADADYDRLGLDDQTYTLLGVEIPYLVIPVRHGRNTTTLVEVAARNFLLKRQGHHSAREFQAKLVEVISANSNERVLGEVVE